AVVTDSVGRSADRARDVQGRVHLTVADEAVIDAVDFISTRDCAGGVDVSHGRGGTSRSIEGREGGASEHVRAVMAFTGRPIVIRTDNGLAVGCRGAVHRKRTIEI